MGPPAPQGPPTPEVRSAPWIGPMDVMLPGTLRTPGGAPGDQPISQPDPGWRLAVERERAAGMEPRYLVQDPARGTAGPWARRMVRIPQQADVEGLTRRGPWIEEAELELGAGEREPQPRGGMWRRAPALAAMGERLGAAWRQSEGGTFGRLGQVARTGLEALNLAPGLVEGAIGQVGNPRVELDQPLQQPTMGPGQATIGATRPGQARGQALTDQDLEAPRLSDYARMTYGDTPEVERALSYAYGATFSGADTMRRVVDRIMAGEDPQAVLYGREVSTVDPDQADYQAVDQYLTAVEAAGGDREQALAEINESGMIPGETDPIAEAVWQTVLDPLNLPIGKWLGFAGRGKDVADATADWTRAAQRVSGNVIDNADEAADLARAAGVEDVSWLQRTWRKANPFQRTPAAVADRQATAAHLVTTVTTAEAQTADEAAELMRRLAQDPDSLTPYLGQVPVSRRAEEIRPVLQQVADRMDDAEAFPSLHRGEFNPAYFRADLDRNLIDAAEDLAGVGQQVERGRYRRFADSYRSLTSELYMRTPGYVVRNTIGDMVTMAYDGAISFRSLDDQMQYVERIGTPTPRLGGIVGGAEAEIGARMVGEGAEAVERRTRLPGFVGDVSEYIGEVSQTGRLRRGGQRTMLGEESRYVQAYASLHQEIFPRVWQPQLSDDLRRALGPYAPIVETALGEARNADELRAALDVIDAQDPAEMIRVAQYLDDPTALPPAMQAELEQRLAQITGPDEVPDLVDEIRTMVRDRTGQIYADDPRPPGRRFWTEIEDGQDAMEMEEHLRAMARSFGIPDDQAAAMADRQAEAIRAGQAAQAAAESDLVARMADNVVDGEDARRLMVTRRGEINTIKHATRREVDRLRAEAWDAYYQLEDRSEGWRIWRAYFDETNRLYTQQQQDVLGILEQTGQDLDRMARGELLEQVLGGDVQDAVDVATEQYRASLRALERRRRRAQSLGLDFEEFDDRLDLHRLAVDQAEDDAWRLLATNPRQDSLDIVLSAQGDVDDLGRRARYRSDMNRSDYLRQFQDRNYSGPRMSRKEYLRRQREIWEAGFFGPAARRWDQARAQLAAVPLDQRGQAMALGRLGWPAEAAAQLTPDQVAGVLQRGVAWDPAIGAPVMSLEDVTRATLGELGQITGIDVSDPGALNPSQWRRLADEADRLARRAGREASEGGRRFTVMGELVGAQPQTVQAGMELARPTNVDDVARAMGVRPQRATADDWMEVAEYARARGRAGMELGTEGGRRGVAAREARRLPEQGPAGSVATDAWGMQRRGRLSAGEEQALARQLGRQSREAADEMQTWALLQAGFGDEEVAGLNPQQRRRLLEEIGQGDLLRTPSGRISQIDAVDPERRAELLETVGQELQGLAERVSTDPEADLAYWWMELADTAELKAQAAAAGEPLAVAPPGMYDAAGLPVLRERATRPGVRDVAAAAEEIIPSISRRAGTAAEWEMEQAWLAEEYADLAAAARARADLIEQGVRNGDFVLPDGATRAKTRRDGPLYLVDVLDDDRRVLATYGYDSWPDARSARDEIRRAIDRGEPFMESTSWLAMTGEDVVNRDELVRASGLAQPPTLRDVAAVEEERALAALDQLETRLVADWDNLAETAGTPLQPGARAQAEAYLDNLVPAFNEAQVIAADAARAGADFSLLNYRDRRNIDAWLSMVVPYHFWQTRSARNWAARFAARPGVLGSYMRYQRTMREINRERGYRGRFEGAVEIPAEFLPEWTGQSVFIDPTYYMFPFASLAPNDWDDPNEARNGLDYVYRLAGKFGMRPYGFLEVGGQLTGVLGEGREGVETLFPQTGALQGATAIAREMGMRQIPPGGINVEAPLRRAMGVREQAPWDPYRVMRQLSNIAGDDPQMARAALIGQELQMRVARGELGMGEAMGTVGGLQQEPGQMTTNNLRRLAQELGWSEEDLRQGQMILALAVQRAGLERGGQSLGSFVGVPARIYPSGEREQVEQGREQWRQGYQPLTGMGSRQQLEAWREAHPEAVTRGMARAVIPGEGGEYESWTPARALASEDYGTARDEVIGRYQQQIDDLIRERPWDTAGVSDLQQQMSDELAGLREQIFGEAMPEEEAETGVSLRSTWGATPEEREEIRREELLAAVSGALPRMSDYTDAETGAVDYEAYEGAVGDFYQDLQGQLGDDPTVQALAADLGREVGDLLGDVTQVDVERYWRRHDSPLEAAQQVWMERYSQAWDRYNSAVERGMDKGDAYERYIEGAGAARAEDLVDEILEQYPDREWTEAQLQQELAGVRFPSPAEASTLRLPPDQRRQREAESDFYDFYFSSVPPGEAERTLQEAVPLLAAVRDYDTRQALQEMGWTAEQFEQALQMTREWLARNEDLIFGDPQEWEEARELNSQFYDEREQRWPQLDRLMDQYFELDRGQRRAFRQQHPELVEYWDWRDQYAAENQLWAKYYRPEDYTGEDGLAVSRGGTGYGASTGGRGGYGGRRSYRRYGGRGGGYSGGGERGLRVRSWDEFMRVAGGAAPAVMRYWEGGELTDQEQTLLGALHKRHGWGTFDMWMTYLLGLYQQGFPDFERRGMETPRVQYAHWIEDRSQLQGGSWL